MYATQPVAITRGHFAEDPQEVCRLIEGIVADLAPRNFIEVQQARQVAMLYLRMDRLERFEAAALAGINGADGGPRPEAYGELLRRIDIADWALGLTEGAELDFRTVTFVLVNEFGFSAEKAGEIFASVDDPEADDGPRRAAEAVLAARFPSEDGVAQWALEFGGRVERQIDGVLERRSATAQRVLKEDMDQTARIYQRISRDLERALAIYRKLQSEPERFVI